MPTNPTPVLLALLLSGIPGRAASTDSDRPVPPTELGIRGGRLVVALRSEPKTFNPVTAIDSASRDVIGRITGSLIRINRATLRTEPSLAQSWTISKDGRRFTLKLRRGVRFADGQAFDADDVVFSFECYLDERNHSPQRDLLIIGGQPIAVRKVDAYTVQFELAAPYAAAERLFDGVAILPRHLLADAQREGRLAAIWGTAAAPSTMTGLGPYRLKSYVPGERAVLEANPNYWQVDVAGARLPYIGELQFLFVPSEDAQALRFQAGDSDLLSRMSAENFAALGREADARGYRVIDLGPGLEYSFLLFNLNDDVASHGSPALRRHLSWFRQSAFRRAVSLALDRDGMVKLAFQGRATPLWGHVTPGNTLWINRRIAVAKPSLDQARGLLTRAGFRFDEDDALLDPAGSRVEFSIITSSANAARVKLATIAQDDLQKLGMRVNVVPLESRAVADRVLQTHDYDVAVMALGSGDADPNSEMNVWLSSGPTHLWNLGQARPATAWEAEIDELMHRQLVTMRPAERKKLYDRVQEIVAAELPIVPLLGPNILVGARAGLANLKPAILDHSLLWNVEELFWATGTPRARR